MALDLFKLMGTVSVETGSAERKLHAIDGAARKTKTGLDAAGDAAEKTGVKFDKASGRMRDASGKFVAGGRQVEDSARRQFSAVGSLSSKLDEMAGKVTRVGTVLTASITLPILGAAAAVTKAAINFESSFAGIRKTIDATEKEFDQLELQNRDLSLEIPVDVDDLNKIGEMGGQLGVAKGEVAGFTKTVAQLESTTNLTADAAATMNAQFTNIMNNPAGAQYDRLGATLVALGNNGASTERQILEMGLRIAGAGKTIGLTEAQTLGFANALASVGIEAEAGGSAISKTMVDVASAVAKGGKELNLISRIAGTTAGDFKQAFERDAAGAIVSFIEGLGKLDGAQKFKALEALGFEDVRLRDTLLRAAGAGDLLRNSLDLAGKAWADNTALTAEAEKRYKTTAAQMGLTWNAVKDGALTIGKDLLGALNPLVTSINSSLIPAAKSLRDSWASLSPATKLFVAGLLAIAAVAGPVLVAVGAIAGALAGLGLAGAVAIGAVVAWGAPLVAMFAAVGAAAYAFYQAFQSNLGGVRDLTVRAWGTVREHTLGLISVISEAWARFYPTLSSLASKALALVVAVWESTGKRVVDIALFVFNAVAPVMRRILAQVLDVVDFVLKVIDGDWKGAWDAFVRFVVAAAQNFNDVLTRLPEIVVGVLKRVVAAVVNAGQKLQEAGATLALRLIAGFVLAANNAPSAIADAIGTALIMGAAGVNAEAIGAVLLARMLAGMRGGGGAAGVVDGNNWNRQPEIPWTEIPHSPSGTRDLPLGNKRGGGGGGKKANDLTSLIEQLSDAEGARALAGAAFDVTQFKAGLDAEESILEASLRAQTVSVADYWKARERITLHGLDSEINLLNTEKKIADETYKAKFDALGKGEKNPVERTLKQQQLSAQWAEKNYQLEGQLAEATSKRAAAMKTIPLEAAAAARELEKSMSALRADALEAGGDSVGAAYERIADKFREMHETARANSALFPDADKWVSALERAEKLSANLARLGERFDLSRGYLSLETARIQDKVTDGVLSEREGRRQVYDLEVRYRDVLRGILGESLAIAQARGDEKAVLSIKQQIEETERLGHVIDDTRAKARGIFEGAFSHGLAELNKGLGHAAATFAIDLIDGIKREADARLTKVISEALFGKTDEFGSDSGLIGKVLERIGLGGVFGGGKGKGGDPAATVTATIEKTAQETQARLDITEQDNTLNRDYNTDRIIAALHELDQTMESMRPQQQGFFKGMLGAALGGFVSGLGGAVAGRLGGLGGGGGADEGPAQPRPTRPPVLRRPGEVAGGGTVTRPRTVGHALGGLISGPGSSISDSIAAFLSNGEFVMSAAAVRGIGVSALQYMNAAGRMPQRFASGGYAGNAPAVAPLRVQAGDARRSGDVYVQAHFDLRGVKDARDAERRLSQAQIDVQIAERVREAQRNS